MMATKTLKLVYSISISDFLTVDGILYKTNPDPDTSVQKKWTPEL